MRAIAKNSVPGKPEKLCIAFAIQVAVLEAKHSQLEQIPKVRKPL
jgi:hypothetical protein